MKRNQRNNFLDQLYLRGNYPFLFGENSLNPHVLKSLQQDSLVFLTDNAMPSYTGLPLQLYYYFNKVFSKIANEFQAEERIYPQTIAKKVLQQADFLKSFPTLAINMDNDYYANPACCFHIYHQLQNQKIDKETHVYTMQSRCFRHEKKYVPFERQSEFTMKEIVFIGEYDNVESLRKRALQKLMKFMEVLQLRGVFEKAYDPFFTSAIDNRGKRLLQQLKSLKFELCLPLSKTKSIAVASFNNHENFFGERFTIKLQNNNYATTGCVAFGIERWMLAFLTQHGTDWHTWPEEVKKHL